MLSKGALSLKFQNGHSNVGLAKWQGKQTVEVKQLFMQMKYFPFHTLLISCKK